MARHTCKGFSGTELCAGCRSERIVREARAVPVKPEPTLAAMSDQHKDAERAHCLEVACDILDNHSLCIDVGRDLPDYMPAVNDAHVPDYVAEIIRSERATARAQGRAEALEEAARLIGRHVTEVYEASRLVRAIRALKVQP